MFPRNQPNIITWSTSKSSKLQQKAEEKAPTHSLSFAQPKTTPNHIAMKISSRTLLLLAAAAVFGSADAFTASLPLSRSSSSAVVVVRRATAEAGTMAEAGVPPAHSDEEASTSDVEIPTHLPSDCGMDYIPLATMLATGQLAEADQVRGRRATTTP